MLRDREPPKRRDLPLWDQVGLPLDELSSVGSRLEVPQSVQVDSGILVYLGDSVRSIPPPRELLARFIGLADASDGAVLSAAQRWGPLYFVLEQERTPDEEDARCRLSGYHAERVTTWRAAAKTAKALLGISSALHAGRHGSQGDWTTASEFLLFDGWSASDLISSETPCPRVDFSEKEWLQVFFHLLRRGSSLDLVNLEFRWNPDEPRPTLQLVTRAFMGAVVVQLMQAVSQTRGWSFCKGCGTPFLREPRHRAYCADCGRKAQWREASRKHYAEKVKGKVNHGKATPR
ncbi:MAG TPA: hypothetical protein PLS53_10315 [Thermoanaerobaculaceae bacterium]|nr:hypothetical protein [Thermoanaerobaculaceae bacterium]